MGRFHLDYLKKQEIKLNFEISEIEKQIKDGDDDLSLPHRLEYLRTRQKEVYKGLKEYE